MLRITIRLAHDESGMHSPASMVLVFSITVIGSIVGLATLRDHIVQQFGDVSVALDSLDQSFRYSFYSDRNGDGDFNDVGEFRFDGSYTDDSPTLRDINGVPPACLNLSIGPTRES